MLSTLSLADVRRGLARKEYTPAQVLESCLERIAATEPSLRACIHVSADEARETAAALGTTPPSSMLDPVRTPEKAAGDDGVLAASLAHKPLWGIPVAVKDVFCVKGMPTTCASRMLEHFIPPYEAFVVERLKQAGAVIVAKTNMDEFAMGSSTERSIFGATANPWKVDAVAGGSSGGSAAAVTAMQVYGALGSDTGGSIRQPAALCGCVGMKPTYGRVSRYGVVAYASSFDQVGPMARTVEDCALLLSVIAGYDGRDATCSALPVPDFTEGLSRDDLSGITLGLPAEYWTEGLSPEVEKACRNAARIARERGATIVDVSLPHLKYCVAAYYILTSAEASTNLARFDGVRYGLRAGESEGLLGMYTASRSLGFGEEVKRRILLGTYALSAGYYDAYYKKASQIRRLILEDFERALEHCDALLAPVTPVTAWNKGAFINDPLTVYKMDILTVSLNLAGLPGLALPVGLGESSGMPVGVQLMGRAFDEAGLLSIGRALETALPSLKTG